MVEKSSNALKISLLTIGNSEVGKSSLLLRFSSDDEKFNPKIMQTIGIDFKMKTIECEGSKVRLQIWDTAGQERFRTITSNYYRKVQGVLLVYDITDRNSFESIQMWMQQIEHYAEQGINKVLVGNKHDLAQNRVVSFVEGETLAREYSIPFFETSAMDGTNVNQAFMKLTSLVIQRTNHTKLNEKISSKVSLQKKEPESTGSGGCCVIS